MNPLEDNSTFRAYCEDAARIIRQTSEHLAPDLIGRAIDAIASALIANRAVLVCGNGGSASDAMHITGELVGRFLAERRALKVICLADNAAVLTAWANDYSYETVFARQVEAYAERGGVLIGLSTSGNSPNVVKAFGAARERGLTTVALTGQGGGKLAALSDILLDVPSRSTPEIQQVHLCMYHYICAQVEKGCARVAANV
jgi:D-sedoheptulose 7-phosphate isomerase